MTQKRGAKHVLLTVLCAWSACLLSRAADAPPSDLPTMSQFVRIHMQDGMLVGDVVPPSDTDPALVVGGRGAALVRQSVQLANVAGNVTIVRRASTLSATVQAVSGTCSMSVSPSIISIARTVVDPDTGVVSRVIFQQRTVVGPAGFQAMMSVTGPAAGGPGQQVVLNLSEASFGKLWAKHPDDVKKYLDPLFRDFGLPSVLEVSPDEAKMLFAGMVLPGEATDEAAIKAKIADILKRLEAESWNTREKARADLLALGKPALPQLKDLDIDNLPVEAKNAVKSALAQGEDGRLHDPDFLLQCVALDDARIASIAHAEYQRITGKKLEIDLKDPAAKRAAQVEKLRLGAFGAGTAATP